jgi:microcystin-dependent protein
MMHPVGSVYMNASVATNPATLLGFGTWATFGAGKVPVGIDTTDDDFDVVGSGTNTNLTTGAKTHTLGVTEIPPHKHQVQIEQAHHTSTRFK